MDLTFLTATQRKGLDFEVAEVNRSVDSENVAITQRNSMMPRSVELIPLKTVKTVEQHVEGVVAERGDQAYSRIKIVSGNKLTEKIAKLSDAKREAIEAEIEAKVDAEIEAETQAKEARKAKVVDSK